MKIKRKIGEFSLVYLFCLIHNIVIAFILLPAIFFTIALLFTRGEFSFYEAIRRYFFEFLFHTSQTNFLHIDILLNVVRTFILPTIFFAIFEYYLIKRFSTIFLVLLFVTPAIFVVWLKSTGNPVGEFLFRSLIIETPFMFFVIAFVHKFIELHNLINRSIGNFEWFLEKFD